MNDLTQNNEIKALSESELNDINGGLGPACAIAAAGVAVSAVGVGVGVFAAGYQSGKDRAKRDDMS